MKRDEIMRLGMDGIEARMGQIRTEMEQDDADITALTDEVDALEERKNAIKAQAEARKALERRIAAGKAGQTIRTLEGMGKVKPEEEEQRYGADSKEYRNAWLKHIAVRNDGTKLFGEMSETEQRAFMHTTKNTGVIVPTELKNEIIELIESEAPMLEDADKSNLIRGFGVPRSKAIVAGDAKGVAEGTANDDEQNTFDLLSLDGIEIKKHIVITRKMQFQSIDAFKTWLTKHLAERIRVAKERNILARLDGIAPEGGSAQSGAGIDAGNILTAQTFDDANIRKVMGMLKGNGARVVYANNATIWGKLAGIVGEDGKKLFIPNSMGDPITQGRIYGAEIKKDENLADNVVYFGIKGQIIANEFDELEIFSAIEPKTANSIITAYALFDSGLKNPKSFVKATFASGTSTGGAG